MVAFYRKSEVEKTVDKLKTTLNNFDNFLEADYNDEEKEALRRELEQWKGKEGQTKTKLAELLMKHLAGKEEEEEQKAILLKTSKLLEETATTLKSRDETVQPLATVLEESPRPATPENRRHHSLKFTRRPSQSISSVNWQFPSSAASNNKVPSRRISRSSFHLAQTILHQQSSKIDQSVCPKSPIEVITLDATPEKKKPSDVVRERRTLPMSARWSNWPKDA